MHRAVRLVAENAASCTLLLYEGAEEHAQHPLLDLLARPNARQDGATLLESVYAHLLLAGNAYLEAVMIDGTVRELHALRPDRMKVVPGPDGWAEAYDYTVAGARCASCRRHSRCRRSCISHSFIPWMITMAWRPWKRQPSPLSCR